MNLTFINTVFQQSTPYKYNIFTQITRYEHVGTSLSLHKVEVLFLPCFVFISVQVTFIIGMTYLYLNKTKFKTEKWVGVLFHAVFRT